MEIDPIWDAYNFIFIFIVVLEFLDSKSVSPLTWNIRLSSWIVFGDWVPNSGLLQILWSELGVDLHFLQQIVPQWFNVWIMSAWANGLHILSTSV